MKPLTFKQYLDALNKFAKENPKMLSMLVITSRDEEGNGYNKVYYKPSPGFFDGDYAFTPEDQFDELDEPENAKVNAICVN